jgi:hypothetical protein
MNPQTVEGDNVRKRLEDQIMKELEFKGIKPYAFNYSDSKVMQLANLKL